MVALSHKMRTINHNMATTVSPSGTQGTTGGTRATTATANAATVAVQHVPVLHTATSLSAPVARHYKISTYNISQRSKNQRQ